MKIAKFFICLFILSIGLSTESCSIPDDDIQPSEQSTGGGIDDPVDPDDED
ncbi:MAG: hypothetical protein JKY22_11595 [Flavobacteriaceae bacterium]|nr:hypothetical protein [Flavobacteriaceae bacterium]